MRFISSLLFYLVYHYWAKIAIKRNFADLLSKYRRIVIYYRHRFGYEVAA